MLLNKPFKRAAGQKTAGGKRGVGRGGWEKEEGDRRGREGGEAESIVTILPAVECWSPGDSQGIFRPIE